MTVDAAAGPGRDRTGEDATPDAWVHVTDALLGNVPEVVTQTLAMMKRLPSFSRLDVDQQRPAVAAHIAGLVDHLQEGGTRLSPADERFYRDLGRERCRQGVSVEDLFSSWRFVIELLHRYAAESVPNGPSGDAILLRLREIADDWMDQGLMGLLSGYRDGERNRDLSESFYPASVVLSFIAHQAAPGQAEAAAVLHGVDTAGPYVAVRAAAAETEQRLAFARLLAPTRVGDARRPLLAIVDDDVCGFVPGLPADHPAVPVGVSEPLPLGELPRAFEDATLALATARALGRRGFARLSDLGLYPAVVADRTVGPALTLTLTESLAGLGTTHATMLDTVAVYLEHDRVLAPTARALQVHVNTVRYRLGRFEELTGRNLRRTHDIVELWWVLEQRRLRATSDASGHRDDTARRP